MKLILGENKIFNSKMGGISSYGHAIILIYFLINRMKCILINPRTFDITIQNEVCIPLAEKLIQYFIFIRLDLEFTKIDISQIHRVKETNEIFQVKDPYIEKDHAKNLSVRNLEMFKDLVNKWISYFKSKDSKLLLVCIKQQITHINKLQI